MIKPSSKIFIQKAPKKKDAVRINSAEDIPEFLRNTISIDGDEMVMHNAEGGEQRAPLGMVCGFEKSEKTSSGYGMWPISDESRIIEKDGVAYIKYVQRVPTGNPDSPSEIIPLIQDGRIFCSVLPFHSENGDRVVTEYEVKDILDDIRTQTLANDVFLQRIKKRKEAASAARLAKIEAEFGDYNFDEGSSAPSSLGPILE